MSEVNSEAKEKALAMLKEQLSGNDDPIFIEKVEAKDRAIDRVSMFIDMTNKESELDLKRFWMDVKQELLNL
jgi:hypothetical protein